MDALKPGDPRRIGPYLLARRLGAGGMGEVFFGRSPSGRPVAVKLIHPWFANDSEFRERFRHEIEACQKVGGFYTVPVVGADPAADRPWMVTAYVRGPSLNNVLAAYPVLPLHTLRVLGAGLAEALQAIHAAGIIHRDLKPSNILLADDGPRVIDFGIARAVDASGITAQHGTPGFMAPEILEKETVTSVTSACDVFSLGVVLAFAGGIRPFGDGPPEAMAYRVVNKEPDLAGLDPQIRGLVAECLARNPEDRPTPARILERLGQHGSLGRWLPDSVHDMIVASLPPREPDVDDGPPDYSRLLAEAEQIARVLPDEYERAAALMRIATVACHVDPPHAARLITDAWRGLFVEYLIESSPAETGTALGHSDPALGDQMLADITKYSRVHVHRHMGSEEETAGIITTIAAAAASANPARGTHLAHVLTDESLQAVAVARVAMVVAHTDPRVAEQLTRTITDRLEQAAGPDADQAGAGRAPRWNWKRTHVTPPAPAPGPRLGDELAKCWAAQALAEVAVSLTGVGRTWLGRPPADVEQFASTISLVGDPGVRMPSTGRTTAGADRARAEQCLSDAEELALGIAASGLNGSGIANADLRARAIAAVKAAAAQVNFGRADSLLLEAEQAARAISTDSERFESLTQVALAAAPINPGRAEQIARSLLSLPRQLGLLAVTIARRDPAQAQRIAATITDEYMRALVRAALMVETATGNAGESLREAERAAGEIPARLIAVAIMTARTDPVRAEQIARTVKSGPEFVDAQPEDSLSEQPAATGRIRPAEYHMRSAEYWKARGLASLAGVSYEKGGYGI